MPIVQQMAVRFNEVFGKPETIAAELFGQEGASLTEAMTELGVALTSVETDFLDALPSAVQAAIRATIFDNLTRKTTVPISLVWMPAYDFELNLVDAPGTAVGPGGISIVLKTRYPLDTHPATIAKEATAS